MKVDREQALKENWNAIMEMKRPCNTRLTPEREEDCRNTLKNHCEDCACSLPEFIPDLLSEIDALRADYRNSLSDTVEAIKQCDQARAHLGTAHLLIGELKAENEKLKHIQTVPYERQENFWRIVETNGKLAEENQKLRERVAKLRVALNKCRDPRARDHKEPDLYTTLGCVMNIADEALAQDDEMERK